MEGCVGLEAGVGGRIRDESKVLEVGSEWAGWELQINILGVCINMMIESFVAHLGEALLQHDMFNITADALLNSQRFAHMFVEAACSSMGVLSVNHCMGQRHDDAYAVGVHLSSEDSGKMRNARRCTTAWSCNVGD